MIEVLVALVMFTIVFTIGITIYVNVIRSSFSNSKLKASLVLNRIAIETKEHKRFVSESFLEGSISIDKEVEDYAKDSQLLIIRLKAFDANHMLLAKHQELWALENE